MKYMLGEAAKIAEKLMEFGNIVKVKWGYSFITRNI